MNNNDELERPTFEQWIADFLGHTLPYIQGQRSTTGRYYNEHIDIPWQVWKARAKQEKSSGETDLSNQR